VSLQKINILNLPNVWITRFTARCFDRRFTEKRQEEKEGLTDTKLFEEKEGQEEGRSLSSLKQQPAASQLPPINIKLHEKLSENLPSPRKAFFNQLLLADFLTMLNQKIS
jgi:hypothetical protein